MSSEDVTNEIEPSVAECLRLREAIWPGLPKFVPTPERPQQDFFEAVAESLRVASDEAEQYRQVLQDGKRLPAPELRQDPAFAAFVLGAMEKELARLRDRVKELEAVLRKIQAWELLNPPRVDLLPDLGWLKAVVVKVNLGPTAEVPGGQPNES